MRRRVYLTIPVAAVVLLAGCGDSPERAVTVGETSAANEPAEATSAPPKAKGAGDELNAKQVKAALLTVTDMPTGWSATPNQDDAEDTNDTMEPASCQAMFDKMDADKGAAKPKAKAEASFAAGGALGTQFSMEVSSFEEDGQGDKVEEVAAALSKCSKITSTDSSGIKTEMELAGLSFPNLGDQTLAMRMNAQSDGIAVVADLVVVATGHNIVTFTAAGLQPMPGADLEKVARTGMVKVAKAAKG